eukprot:1479292-Rhodomonas_salina.2
MRRIALTSRRDSESSRRSTHAEKAQTSPPPLAPQSTTHILEVPNRQEMSGSNISVQAPPKEIQRVGVTRMHEECPQKTSVEPILVYEPGNHMMRVRTCRTETYFIP